MSSIFIKGDVQTTDKRNRMVAFLVANGDDGTNIADPTSILITDNQVFFSKIVSGNRVTKILNRIADPASFNLP